MISDHANRLHDALIAHELLKAVDEFLADSTDIRLLNRLRMARDRARVKLDDYLLPPP
jgi:hypothetical protein